jgi:hypothetical protein
MSQHGNDPRLDPRATVRIRTVLFDAGPDHGAVEMTTRNLSAGGTLCESSQRVPLGRSLTLRIDLPDGTGGLHPVVVGAMALRVEGDGPFLVALHFVNPPARVVDLLRRFVARSLQATG